MASKIAEKACSEKNGAIDNKVFQFRDQDPAINSAYYHKLMRALINTRDPIGLLRRRRQTDRRLRYLGVIS